MAKLPWKPWHEVVELRDDLVSGDLPLYMFAADLYEALVRRGKQPVYESPEEFFALTFPTYNLRRLVRDAVLRLAGKNDKAVRQLELTYGGGKTHTLITLLHLVRNPGNLPDLPSVAEFVEDIGRKPPACRVAGLCFDKLDVEKGTVVPAPDGKTRTLRQPWSVLAYQIAGDPGLRLLHADGKAEERDSAPAENLLTELLEIPGREGLGTLVLIDEVLLYAREKVGTDTVRLNSLIHFFQYLTQAATKVRQCCIVASLLTSEPTTEDELGRRIKASLYDIFQREREEAVEPVVKEDVAEVLRRRFFKPESIRDREAFRPHVVAALKGIFAVDETTAKQGSGAEDRFLKSYPFHPELTEVLYSKWTQLDRFQRTRGVLRTFALALREARKWDPCPLVGPAVFLSDPAREDLSESLRELVTVADTEEWEGKKQAWTAILDSEFARARLIQSESVGLRYRQIEEAVVATFLHSQPPGQKARTRDLAVLLGTTRPDKIELEKGLARWAQESYWLDDTVTATAEGGLPGEWRLGNKPNITQMHVTAQRSISDTTVSARLLDEIGRVKGLTANASAAGVRVHTLPTRPRDIEDDGQFHFGILGPAGASDSGKPSAEARRFLDETTGPDKPRVYRNAVLLLVPSRDGLELALSRVRDYLAWEVVREEIKRQQKDGNVEPARAQTLQIYIERARNRIPDAIRQAYCIVVAISEKDEAQAFKITVTEEPHFNIIKGDTRSRIQDTAIAAETLMPDGPYNLWHAGETTRRVKDLAGAFAQVPRLPKMLKASAILDTLADGCEQGTFVLRLPRPDGTYRTWWMSRPDEDALKDPAMELVLPEAASLSEIPPGLLQPGRLWQLWTGDEIFVKDVIGYFTGSNLVHIERDGYQEPVRIPEAPQAVIYEAIDNAVEKGILWMLSGPASLLRESIPPGVLNPEATLNRPPAAVPAVGILPGNLTDAWQEGISSGLSIATALSYRTGKTLPWATVADTITSALHARFVELTEDSHDWPCDLSSARFVRFREASAGQEDRVREEGSSHVIAAVADLEPLQIQDLGDIIPKLLEIKARTGISMRFTIRIDLGDEKTIPAEETQKEIGTLLGQITDKFRFGNS